MSRYSIKEISKFAKHPLDLWTETVSYWFSIRLLYIIQNTKITPNMLTWTSIIINIIAGIFFFKMERWYLFWGAILYEFAYIFDCADGQLARMKGLSHTGGAILDRMGDRIKEFVVFFSLGTGIYFRYHNIIYFMLAFTALFLTYFNEYLTQQFYLFENIKEAKNARLARGGVRKFLDILRFKNFNIGEQTFIIFIFTIIGKPILLLDVYNIIAVLISLLFVYKVIKVSIKKNSD